MEEFAREIREKMRKGEVKGSAPARPAWHVCTLAKVHRAAGQGQGFLRATPVAPERGPYQRAEFAFK